MTAPTTPLPIHEVTVATTNGSIPRHQVKCSVCGPVTANLAVRSVAESEAAWHRTRAESHPVTISFTTREWDQLCARARAQHRTPHDLIRDRALKTRGEVR